MLDVRGILTGVNTSTRGLRNAGLFGCDWVMVNREKERKGGRGRETERTREDERESGRDRGLRGRKRKGKIEKVKESGRVKNVYMPPLSLW